LNGVVLPGHPVEQELELAVGQDCRRAKARPAGQLDGEIRRAIVVGNQPVSAFARSISLKVQGLTPEVHEGSVSLVLRNPAIHHYCSEFHKLRLHYCQMDAATTHSSSNTFPNL
jgi:hypothetical protein